MITVNEHAYYTPNIMNSSNRSTCTFISQSNTDHSIFINYADIVVHHHCCILHCLPYKGWGYKMTNIPGISDKSKQQLR